MIDSTQEHIKFSMKIGHDLASNTWAAWFSGVCETNFVIPCSVQSWSAPFQGHNFDTNELEQFINFLQEQLKEMRQCPTEE